MILWPKFKMCPSCNSLNVIRINGIVYENNFQSLSGWKLKKIFNCRKCNIELGLFLLDSKIKIEKIIWMELLSCEDPYYNQLNVLLEKKVRCQKQTKKYYELDNKIKAIQNKIRLDQIKIKVKNKIKNRNRQTIEANVF